MSESQKVKVNDKTRQEVIRRIKQLNLGVGAKIDMAISSLLNEKPIYGYCFQRMIRREENRCPTMGVAKDDESRIVLVYNKRFVEENEVYVLHLVLEHEAQHVLRRHIDRAGSRSKSDWNIGADLSVNAELDKEYLNDVVLFGKKAQLHHPEWSTNPTFTEDEWNMSADWYYEKVKNDENGGKGNCDCPNCGGSGKVPGSGSGEGDEDSEGNGEGDGSGEQDCPECGGSGKLGNENGTLDDHSFWKEIAKDAIAKNNISEIAQSSLRRGLAKKAGGGIGGSLLEEIIKANRPMINWKKSLRWFLKKTIYKNHNFTRTRANRRMGWKTPGRKKEYATDLVLAVDTSGSVGDKDLSQFVAEMNKIVDEVGNLTVIEFDGAIRKVTTNVTKVGSSWKFSGRGGTNFNSIMQWALDHKTVDAIVMLTDLYPCDTPFSPKCQILFVGTPDSNESFNPGFGKVVRMEGSIK